MSRELVTQGGHPNRRQSDIEIALLKAQFDEMKEDLKTVMKSVEGLHAAMIARNAEDIANEKMRIKLAKIGGCVIAVLTAIGTFVSWVLAHWKYTP